ncbi:hypothetical protein F383_24567 [Gossypium arboreum]|uniref:Uncharacterized protein n=1 Tax=Gossypium arboreum TaxID=29729 RepID=A0A0B0P6W0_GOSAR|nr:hypothetical protein F383_24567 [Gossypium arboreum]
MNYAYVLVISRNPNPVTDTG